MKLIIFSDCHLEFHRDDGASFVHELVPVQNAVAVVAGAVLGGQVASVVGRVGHAASVDQPPDGRGRTAARR